MRCVIRNELVEARVPFGVVQRSYLRAHCALRQPSKNHHTRESSRAWRSASILSRLRTRNPRAQRLGEPRVALSYYPPKTK